MKVYLIYFSCDYCKKNSAMKFHQVVLFRCSFHHLVENSILYNKRYAAFLHRDNTFSYSKIIRSAVGRNVDGQKISWFQESENEKIFVGG